MICDCIELVFAGWALAIVAPLVLAAWLWRRERRKHQRQEDK